MLAVNPKEILAKSLESGINMKFTEFVKFNGINLNESYVDVFFHNLESNIPIYMSEKIISYFGYKGDAPKQKELLNRLIKENFAEYEKQLYFKYSNNEYIKFRQEKVEISPVKKIDKLYPPALKTRGKTNTTHLLVTPNLFKRMLMLCNTEKGKQVRQYYLDLEEAVFLYIKYQANVDKIQYEKDILDLINKNKSRVSAIKLFDKIINKKYKVGCVYFAKEEGTDRIKIGWCWKLKRRLSGLQVANSNKLVIVKYELTQFPYLKEKELHKFYKKYWIRGEWFEIPGFDPLL